MQTNKLSKNKDFPTPKASRSPRNPEDGHEEAQDRCRQLAGLTGGRGGADPEPCGFHQLMSTEMLGGSFA